MSCPARPVFGPISGQALWDYAAALKLKCERQKDFQDRFGFKRCSSELLMDVVDACMEICRRVLNTHPTDLGVDNSRKLDVLVAGLNHLNEKLAGVDVEFRDEPRPVPAVFGGPALVKEEPNEMNLSAALYGAPSYPSPEVAESSEPPNRMNHTPEIHPPLIHAQTTSQSLIEHRQTDSRIDSEVKSEMGSEANSAVHSETASETDPQTTAEEETLSVTASRVDEPGNKVPVVTATYKVLMHGIRVGSMDMTPEGKERTKQAILRYNKERIPGAVIVDVEWLPMSRRKKARQPVIIDFVRPEDANAAIENLLLWDGINHYVRYYNEGGRLRQCSRCQQYGHDGADCHAPVACAVCAGAHDLSQCTNRSRPICALCWEPHKSWNQSCKYRKQAQAEVEERRRSLPSRYPIQQASLRSHANGAPPSETSTDSETGSSSNSDEAEEKRGLAQQQQPLPPESCSDTSGVLTTPGQTRPRTNSISASKDCAVSKDVSANATSRKRVAPTADSDQHSSRKKPKVAEKPVKFGETSNQGASVARQPSRVS